MTWADRLTAWSTFAQAVIVLVAALVAMVQLRLSRRTRDEQTRPYVIVDVESNATWPWIDLVVRNAGTTPAMDVTFELGPDFDSVHGLEGYDADALLSGGMPMIAPGRTIRMMLDNGDARASSAPGLDYVHDTLSLRVRYQELDRRWHWWPPGFRRRHHAEAFVLPIGLLSAQSRVSTPDVGETLADIARVLDRVVDRSARSISVASPEQLRAEHSRAVEEAFGRRTADGPEDDQDRSTIWSRIRTAAAHISRTPWGETLRNVEK